MVVIYKILQWADKFCEGTIYQCDENKFFSSKRTPQRLPFVWKGKERREERRGRKVYHFNLTFLRMRVNNTYPMESYFFPPQNHIGLYTPCRVLHSQRERQTEYLPGPPTIYLSILPVQQEKGGGDQERSLSCYHPRTDHSVHVAFTRLSTSLTLIPTPERALSRQDP